jgi:hypothetical protein
MFQLPTQGSGVHDLEDDLEDQHILDRKRIKLRESAWYPHYVGGTIV